MGRYSGYPVYHSVYETSEIVDQFYDPLYKNHLVVAKVRGGLVFELAESVLLPFDVQDYADAINNYATIISNMAPMSQLETYHVSFGKFYILASQLDFCIDHMGAGA